MFRFPTAQIKTAKYQKVFVAAENKQNKQNVSLIMFQQVLLPCWNFKFDTLKRALIFQTHQEQKWL